MKESKKKKTKSGWQKLVKNKGLYIALASAVMIAGFYVYARSLKTSLENDFVSFDEQAWQEAVSESGIEVIDVDEKENEKKETTVKSEAERKPDEALDKPQEAVQTVAEAEPQFGMIVPCDGEVVAACSLEEHVYCAAMDDWRTHNGVDIAAQEGAPVKASESGVVSRVYEDELLGVVVVIDHRDGISSVYGNLQNVDFIDAGTRVSRGDIIGGVGKAGSLEANSEPHLHFEIQANGAYKNPKDYVSF